MEDPAELRLLADRLEAVEGVFISLDAPATVVVIAPVEPQPPPPAAVDPSPPDALPPFPLADEEGVPAAVPADPCPPRM